MAPGKGNERGVVYMPKEVWDAIRVEAAKRRMSMGEVIIEALQLRPTVTRSGEKE